MMESILQVKRRKSKKSSSSETKNVILDGKSTSVPIAGSTDERGEESPEKKSPSRSVLLLAVSTLFGVIGFVFIAIGLYLLYQAINSIVENESTIMICNQMKSLSLWVQIIGRHGYQPSSDHMFYVVVSLAVIGSSSLFYIRNLTAQGTKIFYSSIGVRLSKVARTALEIERKTFHLLGLGVPITYQVLTRYQNWTQNDYSKFCWIVTVIIWLCDIFRLLVPAVLKYFPFSLLNKIIREKEKTQLSGTCYFSLGCTLAISIFPPPVSILSIIWLILGDMSAALIGVSFGGETVSLKMGREGKKSIEGSAAMFIVCLVLGMFFFFGVPLAEYAIVVGALAATLVELYEPFELNDNITIPVISCFALQWALNRIQNCR